ncbi:tetratricopeptide repeat protein [Sphingosinithalassobacter portus]|uniref:tetratricopeptide repeat protein n=1 Tax=Stakelama portus TaxID=2676234 RepID=UPI000D6E5F58|nr:tetratricopeptide repeat protein [Sphingosinithalassobacter portus]
MRLIFAVAMVAAIVGGTGSAHAQNALESRVDRLEREMRAVQRKVFPGGAGQYFEPEIAPPQTSTPMPGTPATSPVADLTQRVAALEGQIATLTGQVEQAQYRIRQSEANFTAYRNETDARIRALEARLAPAETTPAANGGGTLQLPSGTASGSTPPATRPSQPAAETPAASGSRAEQVAAVARPDTGDAPEDLYIYGYRLWAAKLYPEARAQLEKVVQQYPNHRRASYAQNLLGRSYLDAGAPSLAAVAFYDNFKNNPNGERAADSLFYLAEALRRLDKPASEICKVYDELNSLYGERLSDQMKADVQARQSQLRCQ